MPHDKWFRFKRCHFGAVGQKNRAINLKRMVMYILAILVIGIAIITKYGISLSEPGYQGPVSDHFNGSIFFNPSGKKPNGLWEALKWGFTRKPGEWKENYENYSHPHTIDNHTSGEVKIMFINHSTFLIQMDELNILTDPVWSERASPLSWLGPKRYRVPGVSFDLLPKVDLVLLSHNHYDHLDIAVLKKLEKLHNPKFIVPLGVDKILLKNGIDDIHQLDWHQHTLFDKIKVNATPAIHFSGRGLLDRDKTLWCGYMLEGSKNIYFAGDTAYDQELFKNIGRKYPMIDAAIIPVGAYKPRWFMSPVHTDPEEAVKIHQDIHSKQSIACHFGTFDLADEALADVPKDLKKALDASSIPETEFFMPDEGVFYTI